MNQTGDKQYNLAYSDMAILVKLIKLIKSINYIKINRIEPQKSSVLFTFINDLGFKTLFDKKIDDNPHYSRIKRFELDGNISEYKPSISVFYNERSVVYELGCTICIYYPTQGIIDAFSNILPQITFPGLKHCPISQIELTFDFYTSDNERIKAILNSHLIPKYNQSTPNYFEDTTYSKNTRTSKRSKSIKIYVKKSLSGCPVRFEITLGDRAIRKYDLNLINLNDVLSSLDLRELIYFKSFDSDKYRNLEFERVRRKDKGHIALASTRKSKYKDLLSGKDFASALINSWIDDYLLTTQVQTKESNTLQIPGFDFAKYEDSCPESAMGILNKLKKGGEKNPLYCFKEDVELSSQFFTIINQGGFLL